MLIFIKRNQSPAQTTTKGKGKHTNQDQTCRMWLTQRLVDPCSLLSLSLSESLFETGSLHSFGSARPFTSFISFISFVTLAKQSEAKTKHSLPSFHSPSLHSSSLSCALLRSLCVCLMPFMQTTLHDNSNNNKNSKNSNFSVVAHARRQRRQRQCRCFGALLSAPLSFAAREIRSLQFFSSSLSVFLLLLSRPSRHCVCVCVCVLKFC